MDQLQNIKTDIDKGEITPVEVRNFLNLQMAAMTFIQAMRNVRDAIILGEDEPTIRTIAEEWRSKFYNTFCKRTSEYSVAQFCKKIPLLFLDAVALLSWRALELSSDDLSRKLSKGSIPILIMVEAMKIQRQIQERVIYPLLSLPDQDSPNWNPITVIDTVVQASKTFLVIVERKF